jgi:hypothetical protein
LKGHTVQYADPRVGFIARRLLNFPSEYLARLQNALPNDGSQRLSEIKGNLHAYQLYLTMEKLPSLVSDLCDLFELGVSVTSKKVRAITAAIDQEEETIQSIIHQFSAHIL